MTPTANTPDLAILSAVNLGDGLSLGPVVYRVRLMLTDKLRAIKFAGDRRSPGSNVTVCTGEQAIEDDRPGRSKSRVSWFVFVPSWERPASEPLQAKPGDIVTFTMKKVVLDVWTLLPIGIEQPGGFASDWFREESGAG